MARRSLNFASRPCQLLPLQHSSSPLPSPVPFFFPLSGLKAPILGAQDLLVMIHCSYHELTSSWSFQSEIMLKTFPKLFQCYYMNTIQHTTQHHTPMATYRSIPEVQSLDGQDFINNVSRKEFWSPISLKSIITAHWAEDSCEDTREQVQTLLSKPHQMQALFSLDTSALLQLMPAEISIVLIRRQNTIAD